MLSHPFVHETQGTCLGYTSQIRLPSLLTTFPLLISLGAESDFPPRAIALFSISSQPQDEEVPSPSLCSSLLNATGERRHCPCLWSRLQTLARSRMRRKRAQSKNPARLSLSYQVHRETLLQKLCMSFRPKYSAFAEQTYSPGPSRMPAMPCE